MMGSHCGVGGSTCWAKHLTRLRMGVLAWDRRSSCRYHGRDITIVGNALYKQLFF